MKWSILISLSILVVFLVGADSLLFAEDKKAKPYTTCPVMGGKINKDIYTDYEGKRYYFCCSACIKMFLKDPAKYIKKLEEQGVVPEDTPKPTSGNTEKINKQAGNKCCPDAPAGHMCSTMPAGAKCGAPVAAGQGCGTPGKSNSKGFDSCVLKGCGYQ